MALGTDGIQNVRNFNEQLRTRIGYTEDQLNTFIGKSDFDSE